MNRQIVIFIIISSIVLVVLVILTSLLRSNSRNVNKVNNDFQTIVPTLNDKERRLVQDNKNIETMNFQNSDRFQSLRELAPLSTEDFDMVYSPVLDTFFFAKKTPDAENKINDFLRARGLIDIKTRFPKLFVITDNNDKSAYEARNEAEEEYLEPKGKEPEESEKETQEVDEESRKRFGAFKRVVNTLFEPKIGDNFDPLFVYRVSSPEAQNTQPNTPISDSTIPVDSAPTKNAPPELAAILNEVGAKVQIAPRLVEAFMHTECGHVFNFSAAQIIEYSKVGNGLPPGDPCFGNSYGAKGPMQFIDRTWAGWASAVNKFGGYKHKPYIENIRDAAYAGAWKIKSDGKPRDPFHWTREEVYTASGVYCGSRCAHVTACPRHCENVWEYYSQQN